VIYPEISPLILLNPGKILHDIWRDIRRRDSGPMFRDLSGSCWCHLQGAMTPSMIIQVDDPRDLSGINAAVS
jgi:hypothetical protein